MQRAAAEGGIGLGSKSAAEHAALATRERKRYGVETHTWREEVQACAGEQGLGSDEVARLLQAGQERASQAVAGRPTVDEKTVGDHLAGPAGLTERSNTFDERVVLQEFAAAQAGALADEVRGMAARFTGREDVIATAGGEMTTAELVGVEGRLIAAVVGRAREHCGVVEDQLTARVIAGADRELTAEQARAVRVVVGSGHGVSVIEALAGTGKTYTAGVLREVYEAAGMKVVGVGPTGRAARELGEEAGIPARTLDRLLGELEQFDRTLPQGCVVILDEAGMAATRASAKLLEAAGAASAKVVAIGDPGQLASVQAGGWLGAVGRRLGAVRLTEVMRQRDPAERRALAALHDRQPAPYLAWAERAGRIGTFKDSVGAREQALAEWTTAAAKLGAAHAVMITRENEMRDALNQAARELRGAQGALGEERDYGGIRVAVGDRVICRRNDRTVDVDNGMRGTVRHIDATRVVIDTDGGLVRELPAAYAQEHLEHAYALTGHGMQGGTVQSAIVLASPHDLSAGWSYTALSRARGETRLLVYEDKLDQERGEYTPPEQTEKTSRAGLMARVKRRMSERDDEDLAIEQLPTPSEEHAGAGRAADPNLATTRACRHEPHQEHAATRAEPNQPLPPTPARLRELRERIKELQAQLHALTPEHSDHAEARAERDSLKQALDEAARERTQILDQLTEREQQAPSQWVKTTLGERPEEPRPRETWEKAARAATSYRSQRDITDPEDPLGPRPELREQRREWASAQRAIERAQRRLHRTPTTERNPADLGIEL